MRSEQADRGDPDIAAIRKANAASLKCYLRDGTERAVAIPKAGNRWKKLQDTLAALDWERLECLDAKGGIVSVVEASDDDLDDLDFDEEAELDSKSIKALAKVMFAIMKNTLTESRKMFEVQTKGNAELVAAMTEGLHQLAEANRLALQVHIAQGVGAKDADDGNELMRMVMMMAMQRGGVPAQALPTIAKHVVPPKPTKPPVEVKP